MLVIEVDMGVEKYHQKIDKYYLWVNKSDFAIDMSYHLGMEEESFVCFMRETYNAKIYEVTSIYGTKSNKMYFDTLEDVTNASQWAESIAISQKMRDI